MEKTIKVFGYGNLLNPESYNNLDCEILSVTPVKLFGFLRVFNFYNSKEDLTLLNIDKSDLDNCVCGIAIEIYQKDLEKFTRLECGTELVIADFDMEFSGRLRAVFFRAEHFEADDFDFESSSQKIYLEQILEWIKYYGTDFEIKFKKTTYIGDKTLFELGY
jgi:hypothetical protein